METLKNGAEVLEINEKRTVVLAQTHRDFVTWEMDADGHCYWGHYFPKCGSEPLAEAVADFHERKMKRANTLPI
jgi:hypothetical protein